MWYKFEAPNSETFYGWAYSSIVPNAACDWLNRRREVNLYSVTEITDDDAKALNLASLHLLVTQDSDVDDFLAPVEYASIIDARYAADSVREWKWGGNASFDGYVQWLWNHNPEFDHSDKALAAYLLSVGEDPKNYDVG